MQQLDVANWPAIAINVDPGWAIESACHLQLICMHPSACPCICEATTHFELTDVSISTGFDNRVYLTCCFKILDLGILETAHNTRARIHLAVVRHTTSPNSQLSSVSNQTV